MGAEAPGSSGLKPVDDSDLLSDHSDHAQDSLPQLSLPKKNKSSDFTPQVPSDTNELPGLL